MSSDPMTPAGDDSSRVSPATSPPSSPPSDVAAKDEDYNPVSESMLEEEKRMKESARQEKTKEKKRENAWSKAGEPEHEGQFKKLLFLVDKSKIFASIMQDRMKLQDMKSQQQDEAEKKREEKQKAQTEQVAASSQRKATRAFASGISDEVGGKIASAKSKQIPTRGKPKKNALITQYLKKEDLQAKTGGLTTAEALAEAAKEHDVKPSGLGAQDLRPADQPRAVSGGVMRGYQLEGLYWLRSLYENGLNGILADEMGLGKTIQTISFLAFLREKGTNGPFLIVAPLSTLGNWIDEFAKWTPSIPTVLYHGNPADRAEIRRTRLDRQGSETFPVVCTSYEICMNDRKFLSQYGWKYIIIDEGHRLKNLNCRLIKELKQYHSANRLLITGTPLQNNLAELWSLLNFLMPEVFDTLENFESFFDFSAVLEKDGHKQIIAQEQKSNLVSSLHAILKPFLLRRVKSDVETDLPKKREYIVYAPLTAPQKELYKQILEGTSRSYLEQQVIERITEKANGSTSTSRSVSLKRKPADDFSTPNKSARSSRASTPNGSIASSRAGRKAAKRKSYKEVSDQQYFREMEQSSESEETDVEEQEELKRAKTIELAKKEIGNKKLQNPIMQLRLACNSPHNFYWPWGPDETPDSSLVTCSGKMLVLERLLPYLFARDHKVLIFSQFKVTLDILEDWASLHHRWEVCRIDGGVSQASRRAQIAVFNMDPGVRLFLLSTRAGGQGINLVAADTVVLFDSDWNPQQDLQAQDRAHRIGQTRPVIVYRLATRGTVETSLLAKADGKRRLEKLVIRKGRFRSLLGRDGGAADADADADMRELARLLEVGDGERFVARDGVLTEAELAVLTDRSDGAYARAERGEEAAGERFRAVEAKPAGVLEDLTTKG